MESSTSNMITAVIAVCAIASPILTALINNHHARRMKKLEMRLERDKEALFYKRSIYEDYLRNTANYIACRTEKNANLYSSSYALALVYFPEELQSEIININTHIFGLLMDRARCELDTLAPKIRAILQQL